MIFLYKYIYSELLVKFYQSSFEVILHEAGEYLSDASLINGIYAYSIFEHFGFDCVTINPYMGSDSVDSFLENKEKGVFLLAKTSNPSAATLQNIKENGIPIYERVVQMAKDLNHNNNIGLVVGATAPKDLKKIRSIAPGMPILIPGVGAQGGDLNICMKIGNNNGISLINISRSISFTGDMSPKSIKDASSNFLAQMHEAMNK